MTTIAELIDFFPPSSSSSSQQGGTHASTSKFKGTSLATDPSLNPDDYPNLAISARDLHLDVRTAYVEALETKMKQEKEIDRYYLDRAKEFVELNEQVQTSTNLLKDLSTFLGTFQKDLSAVSGHIAELQGRSRTIEGRLEARKSVERSLHPYLESITISPSLIKTIIEKPVDTDWVPCVIELDEKLGAIRSGPRIEGRKSLDQIAEALRLAAAQKILNHLISLIKPFTTSISSPLASLQTHHLLPLKPLFDFLRRHAARQAHEFQKAYISTMRWYYETGFRRYVRGLEKLRIKGVETNEPIGLVTSGNDGGLSLLSKRSPSIPSSSSLSSSSSNKSALNNSQLDQGPEILTLSNLTKSSSTKPSSESLFRSISLVLADNAITEYRFIDQFFGTHSSLSINEPRTPSLFSTSPAFENRSHLGGAGAGDSSSASWTSISRGIGAGAEGKDDPSGGGGAFKAMTEDSESVVDLSMRSESGTMGRTKDFERNGKLKRTVVESIWKNVMEPAQEYTRNFISALLDPTTPPSPLSLLSMIRLNESLIISLTQSSSPESEPTCPSIDLHLISIRMQLWPLFSKSMFIQIDSLQKINGSKNSSNTTTNVFGGGSKSSGVKDSIVRIIILRYADLFNQFLELVLPPSEFENSKLLEQRETFVGGNGEEEMVFSHLLKIRQEVDTLLLFQSAKIGQREKEKVFLKTHYDEIVQVLSAGARTSHSRSQAEVAHYRELARKLGS